MNNEELVVLEEEFVPAPQGFLWANVDANHRLIVMNQVEAKKLNLPLVEFELGWNGLYEKGFVPEKPIELCQEEVREYRNRLLETEVDPVVTNPLRWEELSEAEKQVYKDYRRYLLDYTEQEEWWKANPLTLDEWKSK